jgi:hypothetical protein
VYAPGPAALKSFGSLQIQTCFIGTTGLSADGVFASQTVIGARLFRLRHKRQEVKGDGGIAVVSEPAREGPARELAERHASPPPASRAIHSVMAVRRISGEMQ